MPQPANKRLKREDVIAALAAHHGNQAAAARALTPPCNRAAICLYLKRHPDVREAVEQMVEEQVDFVESKLYQLCLEGDVRAIALFLKAHGKPRGYVDRQEVTGADGGPVGNVVIYIPDNGRDPT